MYVVNRHKTPVSTHEYVGEGQTISRRSQTARSLCPKIYVVTTYMRWVLLGLGLPAFAVVAGGDHEVEDVHVTVGVYIPRYCHEHPIIDIERVGNIDDDR